MNRTCSAALLGLLIFAPPLLAAASKPNIVVIVSDDQGYNDLGVQGCPDIKTPNIDSLAGGGIRFINGYVSGPYCSPTRAGLLTGRYQQRFGHEFNPGRAQQNTEVALGLPLTERTLPQRLKQAGYATGMVGKWHLGNAEKFHPLNRGFEEFYGFLGGAHSYVNLKAAGANPILRGKTPIDEPEYLTDAFGREAVAYIDRHKEHPFFLYLAFNAVHGPLEGAQKYLDRNAGIADEKRRTYAAMTCAMDDAIGRVTSKLREAGLEENTLVFYVADNGGPPVNASNNHPLRGHKAQTLEGGIHVPFFIRWPARIPAGKTYAQPVIQLDILATALAAAGVETTADDKVDGVNLLPYLNGQKTEPPHKALYWRFGPQMAIRSGDWKLVRHNGSPEKELYNLAEDIGEKTNLAQSQPDKLKELQTAWDAWNTQLVEPLWQAPSRKIRTGTN